MTQPPRPARRLGRLVTCLLAAAGLAAAWAQPIADATKTYYVGTLTSEAGAAEPVLLDLSLYQDGFAFGRLQLAGRHEVLHGGGTLRDGTLLRLTLAPAPPGDDPWWAAELAHLAHRGEAEREGPGAVAAVLTAERDHDWADEGRTLVGTLRLASGEPLRLAATRLASAARWTFELGRVTSTAVLPRFHGQAAVNAWLEELALPPQQDFAAEGVGLLEEGSLGWAWWREERFELAGAAGPYLSLLATTDVYTGGAHPNAWHESHLVALEDGRVVTLGLEDLFAGEGWLDAVSELVLADLGAQEAMWVVQGDVTSLTTDDVAAFTLDAAGLTFHFSPYAMGPYVQGSFRVTLPFEALAGLAADDGPVAAFARGAPVAAPGSG
ncbi:MAG TPA: DUF3298 domain-containing protein [Trueperaceae bacterium]|nr:DUF3298 domain-containing protein [Trueperaceae bacterium]